MPVVVGLDLSLTGTGIASSNGWAELVTSHGKRNATWVERSARIRGLADQVMDLTRPADLVVIEGPSYRSADPGMFDRAHLWWKVYEQFLKWADLTYLTVAVMPPASRAKYATGKGNAGKGAVIDAVSRRWPAWESHGDDNLADAIVLMAAGRDALGWPITPMPQTHRAALAAVEWPEVAT